MKQKLSPEGRQLAVEIMGVLRQHFEDHLDGTCFEVGFYMGTKMFGCTPGQIPEYQKLIADSNEAPLSQKPVDSIKNLLRRRPRGRRMRRIKL